MTVRLRLPETFRTHPVIAIVRSGRPIQLDTVCDTLIAHGIRHLEVTTNTPGWQSTVARLAAEGRALIGVGTVTTAAQVEEVAKTGAKFIVAPDTNPQVGQAAADHGLGWYPGAMTPTEIVSAWNAGATAVKVFPARSAGGVGYIRDVRAPLPEIPLIPTGGVALDDIRGYLDAGAVGVGLGSPLLGDALTGGSLDELAARARLTVEVTDG